MGDIIVESWARDRTQFIVDPIAKVMANVGISANAITVVSFLLNGVAAVAIALGYPLWGGLLMGLIAMPLDAIDGTVAEFLGQRNKFGAFFDSVFDRFAEASILIGIAALSLQRQDDLTVLLCLVALLGSLMVSYTRARAEGLGIECKVGWFSKTPRVIVVATGLILNRLAIAIPVLAVVSFLTAFHRIIHVYLVTHPTSEDSGVARG